MKELSRIRHRESQNKYHQTPKGRACMKRYKESPKGKIAEKRYRISPKGRKTQARIMLHFLQRFYIYNRNTISKGVN